MEFEEYLKIGLGPTELIQDKFEEKYLIQLKIFSLTRINWNTEFPKDQFEGLYYS